MGHRGVVDVYSPCNPVVELYWYYQLQTIPKHQPKATLRPLLDFTKGFLILDAPVSSRNCPLTFQHLQNPGCFFGSHKVLSSASHWKNLFHHAQENGSYWQEADLGSWSIVIFFFLWMWFPKNLRQKKTNFPGGGLLSQESGGCYIDMMSLFWDWNSRARKHMLNSWC